MNLITVITKQNNSGVRSLKIYKPEGFVFTALLLKLLWSVSEDSQGMNILSVNCIQNLQFQGAPFPLPWT
jgi:hypothetical protein